MLYEDQLMITILYFRSRGDGRFAIQRCEQILYVTILQDLYRQYLM